MQAEIRRAALEGSQRLVGAKLGLTSAAKQERMGVRRPIVGFLTDALMLDPDAVSPPAHGWVQPRIEPEIAFITAVDVDRAVGPHEVESVVAAGAVPLSTGSTYRLVVHGLGTIAVSPSEAGCELHPGGRSDVPWRRDRASTRLDGLEACQGEQFVQHLRVTAPEHLTDDVVDVFAGDPAVSQLSLMRGASVAPVGDIIEADVAREAANELVDRLVGLGVPELGTIHIEPVTAWVSRAGFAAERRTPGASADAVVWADVTQRAYEESELNWTYLSFMTLATLLAAIAIVVDSQVLVIGAMVLGPEFIAIAALGLALVRRRGTLFALAARTLLVGFAVAIAATTLLALAGRALGWVVTTDLTGDRPGTDFIYSPDRWSFVVALIAAAAGVLSLTSAKVGGLSGVFISVTTVPAAGNVALGVAFGAWEEVSGSALQLALNVSGMILAGWATLALQHVVWNRKAHHRRKLLAPDRC